jgi:hypothetical protein
LASPQRFLSLLLTLLILRKLFHRLLWVPAFRQGFLSGLPLAPPPLSLLLASGELGGRSVGVYLFSLLPLPFLALLSLF